MANLCRQTVDARRDQRQCRSEFSMAIPLDDLRGNSGRLQAEPLANLLLDCRIEVGMRADGSAQFTHSNSPFRLPEPLFSPAEFVIHQRQLEPEWDRLRVNALAPADDRRHLAASRRRRYSCPERRQIFRQNTACSEQLNSQRRIENI